MTDTVLVTGGSGFVGSYAILALLAAGYDVRTTVRDAEKAARLRQTLAAGGPVAAEVAIVEADLMADEGWAEAVRGCRYVLHVASPFPTRQPKDPDELIRPAVEGTRRVLGAALAESVERVVMTSSFAAIGYGPDRAPLGTREHPFTEADWTDPEAAGLTPYVRSKTLAERTAWQLVDGTSTELSVINPVGIIGPEMPGHHSSSVELVRSIYSGRIPVLVNIHFGLVDVRDVAALHVLAMTSPDAAGERYLAIAGDPVSLPEMAAELRELPGARVPRIRIPDGLVRGLARVIRPLREVAGQIGRPKWASNAHALALGWQPRPNADALRATVGQ